MPARLNRLHSESVVERIKLSNLVARLQRNAMGELCITSGARKGEPYSMTDGEIRSATFLIERRLAKAEAPKDLNLNASAGLLAVLAGLGKSNHP